MLAVNSVETRAKGQGSRDAAVVAGRNRPTVADTVGLADSEREKETERKRESARAREGERPRALYVAGHPRSRAAGAAIDW
jgi:hypothetical protein